MTDIGEALEKLIEILQIEGYRLFEIFTEVQPMLAIQNLVIILSCIIAGFISIPIGYKLAVKYDWGYDSAERVGISLVLGLIGVLISLLLSYSITDMFMRISYPEYYAAKELISSLQYMR